VYVTSFPAPSARWPISAGGGTAPQWSRSGKAIYYVAALRMIRANVNTANGVAVLSRDTLFAGTVGMGRPTREYDLTPDGNHFLFSAPIDTTNTVIAVLNWRTDTRRTPGARGDDQ
jgi:hypothetical protein